MVTLQLTVPVGVPAAPGEVSDAVAVHVVVCAIESGDGEQLVTSDVARVVAVNPGLLADAEWLTSVP